MRYSYLLAFFVALSLSSFTAVYGGEGGDFQGPEEGGAPPHQQGGDAQAQGPPQDAQGPPPTFDNRDPATGRRKAKIFQPNEQIYIAGGRNCYLRPQCNAEKAKSRYKGKLSGRRIMCTKGKPQPTLLEYIWKAQPCSSAEGKKHHFVRFENSKFKGRLLCLTRKTHKPPKRRYGSHFVILGHRKNGGCAWKVKEAMIYNRVAQKMEKRWVFINRKHKHYTMRVRSRCKNAPPGPRRLFAAQNYLDEARLDTRGTFRVEAAGAAEGGYDTQQQ